MTSKHLELERKYEVDAALAWVDLTGLPGVTGVAAPEVFSLRATYYDTERLRPRAGEGHPAATDRRVGRGLAPQAAGCGRRPGGARRATGR